MIVAIIAIVALVVFGLGIWVGVLYFQSDVYYPDKANRFPPDPEIDKWPMCTCTDVNVCETWCRTKALFVKYPPEDYNL